MQMYGSDLQYENPYFASSTENFLEEERNVSLIQYRMLLLLLTHR